MKPGFWMLFMGTFLFFNLGYFGGGFVIRNEIPVLIPIIVYLICAIPFGYLLAKQFAKTDLRKIGSGSTGATNVLRTGNKWLALATLVLDTAKPIIAYFLLMLMYGKEAVAPTEIKMIITATAVIAHCFPVYLKFKGGKGVATAWGTMFLFSPILAVGLCALWMLALSITKKSSLSALVAAAATPFAFWLGHSGILGIFYACMVLFVVVRHTSNIKRLIAGTESKVDFKTNKKKHARRRK